VSTVRYELSFYIPEDDFLHGHRRENLNLMQRLLCFMISYFRESAWSLEHGDQLLSAFVYMRIEQLCTLLRTCVLG
jgi:hypothetical protein